MKRLLPALLVLLLLPVLRTAAQTVAPFKVGDRVVFLGNSITDGGHYHSYIWLYYMTRLPNTRVNFYNAGIGGDNVKQMSDRFEQDVMPMNPTVLTLTWGMNDTGYFEWYGKDAAEVAKKNITLAKERYKVLEAKLAKTPNVKKIFLLGSPYDETTTVAQNRLYKGKAAALKQLIDFQAEAAKKNGYGMVDFYNPMTAINEREQQKDPAFSLTPGDRIHPDNHGHMVMAYQFLKTQGFANQVVADVAINAGSKAITKAVNSIVTNVSGNNAGISFNYLAKALPYPLDTIARGWGNNKSQAAALPLIPFTKEFNQELVTVKGLQDGNYKLSIDNELIATYTARQLAEGVNLAEQTNTPQYQQAIQIRELNEERWEIERRFRNYAFIQYDLLKDKGLLYADNRAAMDTVEKESLKNIFVKGNKDNYMKAQYKGVRDAWKREMDVLVQQIYTINKPVTHRIKIALVN